jgi:glycerol-3-phosphate dehydrogenase
MRKNMENTDIFIIGGGINGAAIAADAAGRGLSVTLCEKSDLASATSSASTKLIHGGLRYLEQYDFKLVRIALREREVLMRKAPHLITPLEFVLPYEKHLRPAWLIRLGLFFYDHLSRRDLLPKSKYIHFKGNARSDALATGFSKGFSYYDCFTDDARLTVLNALAAKENGACILTRHEFISAKQENNLWKITLKNLQENKLFFIYAKALINTSGPWVSDTQKNIDSAKKIASTLVKGSHIIVPKIFEGDFAYILQNTDGRVVFAIPYQQEFTLIGTTDVNFFGNLDAIKITSNEENYLCTVINNYFKKSIAVQDILWSYAGVRCLQREEDENKLSKITRDYKIIVEMEKQAPLFTIIGGKITTHRILAEEVVDKLKPYFPNMGPAWTANAPLPGGDFINQDVENFFLDLMKKFPWLPRSLARRYISQYGTRVYLLLDNAKEINDLGEKFSANLYQKEINYLIQYEWAKTVEDILWRRTKLGLFLTQAEQQKLFAWHEKQHS